MGVSNSSHNWMARISFYPDIDEKPDVVICKTSRNIPNEPTLIEDSRESILQVYSYKVPILNITGTCLLFYHRFVIIETKSWWWSIEKNNVEIIIQRSKNEAAVKNKILGEKRNPQDNIQLEEQDSSNVNVRALLEWLDIENETFDRYHLFQSNCQVFGKRVYEHLQGKKQLNSTPI